MRLLTLLLCVFIQLRLSAQATDKYLSLILEDAIRIAEVPGAACAVITSDSIRYGVSGVIVKGSDTPITPQSLFHIGSCTKSITGFIAAKAIKEGLIKGDTKFFDVFPRLRAFSRSEYEDITLFNLLEHQALLQSFSSEKEFKNLPEYAKDDPDARVKFAQHVLSLKPIKLKESYAYSNAGYTLAALMLEKVSDRTWEELVSSYFKEQGWEYHLGYASYTDDSQPSGHYRKKRSVYQFARGQNFDVPAYLAPAGDISMRTVDYAEYLQQQLVGILRGDKYLSAEQYCNMHYHNKKYALGWGHGYGPNKTKVSAHTGSAGAFLATMLVVPKDDVAVLVVMNIGDDKKSAETMKSIRNRIIREVAFKS